LAPILAIGCGGDGGSGRDTDNDRSRPSVTYVSPVNNKDEVSPNTRVAVTFSEAMNKTSLSSAISLREVGTNTGVALRELDFDTVNNIATVTPEQPLAGQKRYRVRVSVAATDLAGNPILAAYESHFATAAVADPSAPTVTSFAPRDGETGVGANSAVAFAFSEPMYAASLQAAFTLSDGASPAIMGSVKYIGQTGVFEPAAPLLPSAAYTVSLTSEAESLTGKALAPKVWRFVTGPGPDTTRPKVLSVVPGRDASGVSRTTVVSATFDSPIYPFLFGTVDGFAVPVLIDYSTYTVTLAPTVPLPAGTPFTTTITASDLADNANSYSWNFVTSQ
jgi:hypothetical protein